jgi:hypothetical protein
MKLTRLILADCNGVRNLTPLEGMALIEFNVVPKIITTGLDVVRKMKSLGRINYMPAGEFWKKYDAGEFK